MASKDQTEFVSYDIWQTEIKKRSVNARYWLTIIDLEVILVIFIKNISNADFDFQGLIFQNSFLQPVAVSCP